MTKDTFLTQLMLRVEGGSKDLLAVNAERVAVNAERVDEWACSCGLQIPTITSDIW